jgi:hypothetical protein
MNLKEFARVDFFNRDLDTGKEISWHDYMGRVIEKLGLENIKPYIPYSLSYLKEKVEEDKHLNNTNIHRWDAAAGYSTSPFRANIDYLGTGIASLFVRNGITCFSLSDGVCVLKEAARRLCEDGA